MTTWTGKPFNSIDNQGIWQWSDFEAADNMISEIWKAMLGCGLTHVSTTYYGIDYDDIPDPYSTASNWPDLSDNFVTVTGPTVGMELADEFRNYLTLSSGQIYTFRTVFKFNDGLKEVYISFDFFNRYTGQTSTNSQYTGKCGWRWGIRENEEYVEGRDPGQNATYEHFDDLYARPGYYWNACFTDGTFVLSGSCVNEPNLMCYPLVVVERSRDENGQIDEKGVSWWYSGNVNDTTGALEQQYQRQIEFGTAGLETRQYPYTGWIDGGGTRADGLKRHIGLPPPDGVSGGALPLSTQVIAYQGKWWPQRALMYVPWGIINNNQPMKIIIDNQEHTYFSSGLNSTMLKNNSQFQHGTNKYENVVHIWE